MGGAAVNGTADSVCAYHVHGETGECYLRRRQAVLARQEIYTVQRLVTTKRSQKATDLARSHGVDAVDWQARRGRESRIESAGVSATNGAVDGLGKWSTLMTQQSENQIEKGTAIKDSLADCSAELRREEARLKIKIVNSNIERRPLRTATEEKPRGVKDRLYDTDSSEHDEATDEDLLSLVRSWRYFQCPGTYPETPAE
jgi:hypothetical protein